MTKILVLEKPEELLRIKRENILREISLYGERERDNLRQAMQARKARKELEAQLFDFDNTIDTLGRLKEKEIERDKQNSNTAKRLFDDMSESSGVVKTKTAGQYLDEIYYQKSDLLKRLSKAGFRYLARDKNGELWAYADKPEKAGAFWTNYVGDWIIIKNGDCEIIRDNDFSEIKWEDEEPMRIADLLEIYQNGGENGKKEVE